MEDDWTEYYSNISNFENYYDDYDSKNHSYGFVNRKLKFWTKYYQKLKKENPKHWNFYNNPKLAADIFAFDELSEEEKKIISN